MADLNGEHFKFKELALATMRVDEVPPEGGSRRPRGHVEHRNAAETVGEVGAALGLRGGALGLPSGSRDARSRRG